MVSTTLNLGNQTVSPQELISLLTRYQLLPRLLRERIIDEAIQTIECTPEEVTQACQQFCQQHQLTSDAVKTAWLLHHNMNQEQFEALATRPLQIDKFKQSMWGHRLKAYFLNQKTKYDKVIYSMLRVTDLGVAQELFYRIDAKEQSFTEVVRQYSEGEEKLTGGLTGPVALGELPHKLAQMLILSQPGKLWAPFQFSQWYLIIRLEQFIPCQFDASIQQLMLNELFEAWIQEQLSKKTLGK
jgi:parvulin-like peptidyl-prolyl isomerase